MILFVFFVSPPHPALQQWYKLYPDIRAIDDDGVVVTLLLASYLLQRLTIGAHILERVTGSPLLVTSLSRRVVCHLGPIIIVAKRTFDPQTAASFPCSFVHPSLFFYLRHRRRRCCWCRCDWKSGSYLYLIFRRTRSAAQRSASHSSSTTCDWRAVNRKGASVPFLDLLFRFFNSLIHWLSKGRV